MRKMIKCVAPMAFVMTFATAALHAQNWTPAGPDDANQPAHNYVSYEKTLKSDLGKGFYLLYVDYAWQSPGVTGQRASVRHWDGTTWKQVGQRAFSASYFKYADMAIAPGPKPYVIYQDFSQGRKAVVQTFNGTSWVNVGAPVSPGPAERNCIAIDPSGTPYVAYVDSAAARTVTVKKWDGTTWQTVGTPNFTTASVVGLRLAVGVNGLPQLLTQYQFNGNTYLAFALFNGTTWGPAGSPSGSTRVDEMPSLALGKRDTAYVAFSDYLGNRRVRVAKLDGFNTWTAVGTTTTPQRPAEGVQLVIDTLKGMYLLCNADTFTNGTSFNFAMVYRYNGSAWAAAGPDSFINRRYTSPYTHLGVDTTGAPHVLVSDYKPRLLKLDNNSWKTQGNTEGISNGPSYFNKVVASPDGKKAFAMTVGDYYGPNNTKVYEYNSNNTWTLTGQHNVGGLKGTIQDITVHPNGEPWIIMLDSASRPSHSIWKLSATGWTNMGFKDTGGNARIAIDDKGHVFVVIAPSSTYGFRVHKFDGSTWSASPVQSPNGIHRYLKIRVNKLGEPIVLAGGHFSTHPNYEYAFEFYRLRNNNWQSFGYVNSANGTHYQGDPNFDLDANDTVYTVYPNTGQYRAKVQKFDEGNWKWIDVVAPVSEPVYTVDPTIQFAADGSLYLCYGDRTSTSLSSVTVKRLSGNTWQTVGNAEFSGNNAQYSYLAILNNRLLTTFTEGAVYGYKYDCNQPATISAQPRDTAICSGNNAIIYTTATGATAYRWQYLAGNTWKNVPADATHSGTDNDTLFLNAVPATLNGVKYRCVLINTCDGTNISEEAKLVVDNASWPAATVAISADKSAVCQGTPVTFKAITTNKGVLYEYEWRINNTPVPGAKDSIFTTSALSSTDAVTCTFTRLSACALPPHVVASSPLTVQVSPTQAASVSIAATPGTVITSGQNVSFNSTVNNAGPAAQYQWLLNGGNIGGATANTYSSNTLANGDAVALRVTRTDNCATPNIVTSSPLNMTVWPVSVGDIHSSKSGMQVYPQPARGQVVFSNTGLANGNYKLQLFDVAGRMIHEQQLDIDAGTAQCKLPASVPAGNYAFKISGPEKIIHGSLVIAR